MKRWENDVGGVAFPSIHGSNPSVQTPLTNVRVMQQRLCLDVKHGHINMWFDMCSLVFKCVCVCQVALSTVCECIACVLFFFVFLCFVDLEVAFLLHTSYEAVFGKLWRQSENWKNHRPFCPGPSRLAWRFGDCFHAFLLVRR